MLKTAGVDDVPKAKVAVIDGNALAPNGDGNGPAVAPEPSDVIDPPQLPTSAKRRFVGSVSMHLSENTGELHRILDEVLMHMSGKGLRLSVQLDIDATNVNPIPPALVRTVSENANSLGFSRAEFN